jgi:hypothetical protein
VRADDLYQHVDVEGGFEIPLNAVVVRAGYGWFGSDVRLGGEPFLTLGSISDLSIF